MDMSRWKALPESVDPQVRQLVVQLRRLKDHSGLNLKSLEAKTGYSRSSWERYLNGKSLPPSQAVEELAQVCGADPIRLLALHEVAEARWGQGGPVTDQKSQDGGDRPVLPEAPARRPVKRQLLGAAAAVVTAGVLAALLVTRPWHDDVAHAARATVKAGAQPSYTCDVHRKDGHWYSGNSATQDAVLEVGMAGPEVAEAQCLLERAGFSPGGIDGIYGNLTQRAVKREQQHAKLVVDGIVGPHTWAALRG
jgi:transcriptional regulator with XRE-family HTH domain